MKKTTGAGGWRERAAAKKAAANGGSTVGKSSKTELGEILRISRTGFGFVGSSHSTRQRLHFQFSEVTSGDPTSFKVGDSVTYETRLNDTTMEKEAFNIQSNQSHQRNTPQQQQRTTTLRRSQQTAQTTVRKTTTSNPNHHHHHQQTNDTTDQFGNQRSVQSGTLLDIIDGGDECVIAKSCDDYDVNQPKHGNGFSIAYQRTRGKIITADEELRIRNQQQAAAKAEEQEKKEETRGKPPGGWRRRGQTGGSRSLADMM